ncbi:MAG TPA: hypothetical protein VN282_05705 [Pyrinomonadaceae bacterium]|nr:hypothetical protein [Pyrinomonadaceae bacterium]
MSRTLIIPAAILLLLAAGVPPTHGQGRGARRAPARRPAQATPRPNPPPRPEADQYWAAQRNIEAAIQQLEAYLRRAPEGDRAATARRQLAALRGLSASAALPEWVRMGESFLRDAPEWRVASVDPQPDRTRLTVEVACRREDGGDCYFRPFDSSPLVLVDAAGRFHPMLEASALPADVRRGARERQAAVSGGRAITFTVDFAPLAADAASGQIYYRDDNQARPARFTLNRHR